MTLKIYSTVPNRLIDDSELEHNAKHIAVAMIFAARNNTVRNLTIRRLAKMCRCSVGTVQKHLGVLEQKGYITKRKCYRYSLSLGRYVNDTNEYTLTISTDGGYTLVPRSILRRKVTGACFAVMLYLYRCAGREGRAYPSLRYISGARKDKIGNCGVSKASVCRALQLLKKLKFFIDLPCERKCGDLSCNTYWLTDMVGLKAGTVKAPSPPPAQPPVPPPKEIVPAPAPSLWGGLKNRTLSLINKITSGLYLEGKDKGVSEFGTLYNTLHGMLKGFFGLKKRLHRKDAS